MLNNKRKCVIHEISKNISSFPCNFALGWALCFKRKSIDSFVYNHNEKANMYKTTKKGIFFKGEHFSVV